MCVSNSVCQLFCLIPATQIEVQSNRIFDKIISYTVRDVPFSLNKIYMIFLVFFRFEKYFFQFFTWKPSTVLMVLCITDELCMKVPLNRTIVQHSLSSRVFTIFCCCILHLFVYASLLLCWWNLFTTTGLRNYDVFLNKSTNCWCRRFHVRSFTMQTLKVDTKSHKKKTWAHW